MIGEVKVLEIRCKSGVSQVEISIDFCSKCAFNWLFIYRYCIGFCEGITIN